MTLVLPVWEGALRGGRAWSPGRRSVQAPVPGPARLAGCPEGDTMRGMRGSIADGLVLGLLLALASAGVARGDEALTEVGACMGRNLPAESSVQDVRFVSRDRLGNEREILATLKWKRFENDLARVVIRVEEPEDLRNSAVLLIQREGGADLFTYLPELRKVRRIHSRSLSGNLFGSDFTYADFQLLHGMLEEGAAELAEAELDGKAVWVVSQRPAVGEASDYERVVSFVDRGTCLLWKAEMWEAGGRLRKVLRTDLDGVFEEDGVRLPRRVVLEDLKRETSTRLELTRIDLHRKPKRAEFSPSALER